MATIIKNVNPEIPDCDGAEENIGIINDRITENFDLGVIRADVGRLNSTVSGSDNPKIRDIKRATTFPIKDILQMMIEHEGCKYIRVYNGSDSSGKFITYLVPLDEKLNTYDNCKTSSSCCHCRPCRLDKIINAY